MSESLPVWLPPLMLPHGVRIAQTLRGGEGWGFNLGTHVGAPAATVIDNRARLVHEQPGLDDIQWLTQVHDTGVLHAPAPGDVEADAQWTTRCGLGCAVMTADCLPILFWRADGAVVGAIHAGWRGLAAGVIEAAVQALPPSASALQVWLGPRIGPAKYEVGGEVRSAFVEVDPAASAAFNPSPRAGHWFADLGVLARLRLAVLGIGDVTDSAECTVSAPQRWFSHRREGRCGRMASVIWRVN